jgi:hypothetical protein
MSGPGSSVTERDPMAPKLIKNLTLIDRGRRGDG